MSKILHFHFQKSIFGSFSNSFSFFFIVKQQIFSVWRFSTANFQAFIFFNFVFMKIFFRLNFVKFKCEFFSDFWRIKIQNFRRNFLGSCTLRKSIGEVRGIRRTLVQEFTNEADAFSDWLNYIKKQYEKQRRKKILQIQCRIQARILPI